MAPRLTASVLPAPAYALSSQYANTTSGREGNAETRQRFIKEARITGQLEHPNIIPVYELAHGPGEASPYYTMRIMRGRTLSEHVKEFHERRAAFQGGL